MKKWTCIFFVIFLLFLSGLIEAGEVNADMTPRRPRRGNSSTSCAMSRARLSKSDIVTYRFGVVAGQNISTIKSKNTSIMDITTGLTGGAAAQIIWPGGFVLQPEIRYSQKGCMFSGSGLKYKIEYFEMPVNIMYRLNIADIKPFAFVSPYGAYGLKLTEIGDITSDEVLSDELRKPDYGIGVGAGFDVWRIQVSFKYSWGFAQVMEETFNIRNRVFSISLGVFL